MLAGNSTLALSVIPCADSMRVVATVANAELRAMSHISSASTSSSSWQISFAAGPYGYDFKFQAVQVLFSWHLRGYSSSCSSAGMGTTEVSSDTWDTTAGRLKSKEHRPLQMTTFPMLGLICTCTLKTYAGADTLYSTLDLGASPDKGTHD